MIEYCGRTYKGTRAINEDTVRIVVKNDMLYCIVADGLGGQGKGDVASAYVAQTIENGIRDLSKNDHLDIKAVIEDAQAGLMEIKQQNNDARGYMTTLVFCIIDRESIRWAHVGDSRLYLFQDNRIEKQTKDHSYVQYLVDEGKMDYEQIRGHKDSNRLIHALGDENRNFQPTIASPVPVIQNQALLLCSDGFWQWITEKEMLDELSVSNSAEEWMENMLNVVRKNSRDKSCDNCSAVTVFINRQDQDITIQALDE